MARSLFAVVVAATALVPGVAHAQQSLAPRGTQMALMQDETRPARVRGEAVSRNATRQEPIYVNQYGERVHLVQRPRGPRGGGGLLEQLFGQNETHYVVDPAPVQQAVLHGPGDDDLFYDDGETTRPGVDPKYDRQVVNYGGRHAPGTVVIDTPNRFLYLVQAGGTAIRYGIGVGKPGFTWAGTKTISMKKEWPDWVPPKQMLQRRPDLPRYMEGGPDNPLGARAMYLGSTLYRIHGSNEPWTIGTAVSSGCIRMRNEDVVDLYNRVRVGTRVVVI